MKSTPCDKISQLVLDYATEYPWHGSSKTLLSGTITEMNGPGSPSSTQMRSNFELPEKYESC